MGQGTGQVQEILKSDPLHTPISLPPTGTSRLPPRAATRGGGEENKWWGPNTDQSHPSPI
eukprot:8950477-Karenia_brevis.AAC.1